MTQSQPNHRMNTPKKIQGNGRQWLNIPQVELKGKLDPNNIHVTLSGTEFNSSHYIEKVGLVDKEKKELVSKSLEKGLHEASLTYKYDFDDLKDMKVYVKCNLHDVWTLTLDKAEIKR